MFTNLGYWRNFVFITYENKTEDIRQMQAAILPRIGINESLKICPINVVTTCPTVVTSSFGILSNVFINSCARLYTWFRIIVLCRLNPIDSVFPKSTTF